MKRIDSVNARDDVNGTGKKGFHDNGDLPGQDATYLTPDWLNHIQEEIANVVEYSGQTLDGNHFEQLLSAIQQLAVVPLRNFFRVGSWHGTDDTSYDPAAALEGIFGYRTVWSLRPYAPYGVNSLSEAILNQIDVAGALKYKASTTRIWKRMPDDYQNPIYQMTTNKSSVNEGESVTFTLDTDYVVAGTQLGWKIIGVSANDLSPSNLTGFFTVGPNGLATHTLTAVADQTTEGAETLTLMLIDDESIRTSIMINDTSKVPTYKLTANKSTLNSGDSVTVTLETTSIPAGETIDYSIVGLDASSLSPASITGIFTVGPNGNATTTFTILNLDTQMSLANLRVILKDEKATLYIAKNIAAMETVINLGTELYTYQNITDISGTIKHKESANLRSVFNDFTKRSPWANERIRFIIPADVAIIGDTVNAPALTSGTWLSSNQITIENDGFILGRGATGYRSNYVTGYKSDGGTALYNSSIVDIHIENTGIIAGGGGSGGMGGGYPVAGGAPFCAVVENTAENLKAQQRAGFRLPGTRINSDSISAYSGAGGAWGEAGEWGKTTSSNGTPDSPGTNAGIALSGTYTVVSNTGTIKGSDRS